MSNPMPSGIQRIDSGSLDVSPLWHVEIGDGPLLGAAIHAGHDMRPEVLPYLAIDETTRLREEDPYADYWTQCCGSRLVVQRSRFEVDLNRPRDEAICVNPEDCWDLTVWTETLNTDLVSHSLAEHDAFFRQLSETLELLTRREGKVIVFDFHSYNHRRGGRDALPADPAENPDINVGTGTMDRTRWGPVVDRLISDLSGFDFGGRHLDVRENVRFRGRNFAHFVHSHYPETCCVLAIEVKKFFMDEWTGIVNPDLVKLLLNAFRSTVPGLIEELNRQ